MFKIIDNGGNRLKMKIISQDGLHKYEISDYFVDIENATIYGNIYSGGIVSKIFLGKYANKDLCRYVFKQMIDYDGINDYCYRMPQYDGCVKHL